MKKYLTILFAIICMIAVTCNTSIHADMNAVTMYRLYNKNSGEHFYTAKAGEKDYLVKVGWNDEGIGWYAPQTGDAVYRVYNPNSGDHHYTLNEGEKNALVKLGWKDEGIGWYSVAVGDRLPLYRQYNPNELTGNHNYTTNTVEKNNLISLGWDDEGIAWYAVNSIPLAPGTTPTPEPCVPAWDETVVDSDAWTEEILVTEGYDTTYCNTCHQAFTGPTQIDDVLIHLVFTDCAGYHTEYTQPVYQTVEHPAVTHIVHHEAKGC